MIGTVFRISLLRLWNNKHEVVLALAVPIMFFSIFALIFSRGVGETVRQVRVTFVDDDKTLESRAIIQAACRHQEIQPTNGLWRTDADWPIEKLSKLLISQKAAEVVVHIPAGFTTQDPQAPNLSIQLYNEGTNPIAHRVVQAGLAESIALQFAEANMEAAFAQRPAVQPASATRLVTTPSTSTATSSSFSSPQTGSAHQRNDQRNDQRTDQRTEQRSPSVATSRGEEQQVFQSIDVFATNKHQPKIALYAAGIAVMFLLFSASGTGASLLEEREAGTLGRLMTSRLSVTELVLGKWLFAAALGSVQLVIMFVWGQVMFRVDLWGHIPGFVAMTCATSAASASFALFLATLCRSRQQLHGISIVLILGMSAVGGSMVPRYIMSDSMRQFGKFTFNGWALDGFQKVFWYDMPLHAIRNELFVLLSIAILLGALACLLAQRWSKI